MMPPSSESKSPVPGHRRVSQGTPPPALRVRMPIPKSPADEARSRRPVDIPEREDESH